MDTTNTNRAKHYFQFLENLDVETKLKLISKLSASVKKTGRKRRDSLQSLFGAFRSQHSADTLINNLKKARHFNRTIEKI